MVWHEFMSLHVLLETATWNCVKTHICSLTDLKFFNFMIILNSLGLLLFIG